jgi:sulfur relay (sulfurtransferase) DsrF/TusC family protein
VVDTLKTRGDDLFKIQCIFHIDGTSQYLTNDVETMLIQSVFAHWVWLLGYIFSSRLVCESSLNVFKVKLKSCLFAVMVAALQLLPLTTSSLKMFAKQK